MNAGGSVQCPCDYCPEDSCNNDVADESSSCLSSEGLLAPAASSASLLVAEGQQLLHMAAFVLYFASCGGLITIDSIQQTQ